jgi:hypothetical protein
MSYQDTEEMLDRDLVRAQPRDAGAFLALREEMQPAVEWVLFAQAREIALMTERSAEMQDELDVLLGFPALHLLMLNLKEIGAR